MKVIILSIKMKYEYGEFLLISEAEKQSKGHWVVSILDSQYMEEVSKRQQNILSTFFFPSRRSYFCFVCLFFRRKYTFREI